MENAVDQGATAVDTSWINEIMADEPSANEPVKDDVKEVSDKNEPEPIEPDEEFRFEDELEDEETETVDETETEPDEIVLKVYDKEISLTSEEVIELAQKQLAATEKFEDLKQREQAFKAEQAQFESSKTSLKEFIGLMASGNPDDAVEVFAGLSKAIPGFPRFEQLCEAFVNQQLEWANMPDHERQLRIVNKEKAALEQQRQALEKEQSERIQKERSQQAFNMINEALPHALAKVGLDANPTNLKRVGEVWLSAVKSGHNPSPEQVVTFVKQENEKLLKERLINLSPAEKAKLPAEVRKKLGIDKLQKVKQNRAPTVAKPGSSAKTEKPRSQYKSMSEYLNRNW